MPTDAWTRAQQLIARKRKLAASGEHAASVGTTSADLAAQQQRRAVLTPAQVRGTVEHLRQRPG